MKIVKVDVKIPHGRIPKIDSENIGELVMKARHEITKSPFDQRWYRVP